MMLQTMPTASSAKVNDAASASPSFLAWVASLVHEHRGQLLAYARHRGLDAEDALDAVQDSFTSFLTLPEARALSRDREDAIKMLTVILRHHVMNRRSKQARHGRAQILLEAQAAHTRSDDHDALVAHAEELARVQGCIVRMAKLQRNVVMLSLLDEQPHEEVAKILGISPGYVRVLVHRAREHIRMCSYIDEAL
ncbi:sigma-70 family RNA polymerase sigma factor [Pendulispora brunnea]|uniref:Sigma-70 family RNA polymerase sigma factor n=1 Tax=Pendulispora brunnea TaxID=2905690 RepID=A0ABZ2JW32_9BACT